MGIMVAEYTDYDSIISVPGFFPGKRENFDGLANYSRNLALRLPVLIFFVLFHELKVEVAPLAFFSYVSNCFKRVVF